MLLFQVEVLKSSIQMSTGRDVKLYVTEPTELEVREDEMTTIS